VREGGLEPVRFRRNVTTFLAATVTVLLQRQQLAESLAWMPARLGLERRAKDVTDLTHYLETKPPSRSITTPTTPTEDRP
jgi:hypothetical protein